MPILKNDILVLSPEEKQLIQSDADFILAEAHITELPIPIDKVISITFPRSKVVLKDNMPEGLKGTAYKGYDVIDIYINRDYPEVIQRFTKGHELGHLLSDESGARYDYEKNQTPEGKFKEHRANYYSACFLMPEKLVRKYFRLYQNYSALTKIFNVSFFAMILRLKHLGLIDPAWAEILLEPTPSSSQKIIF